MEPDARYTYVGGCVIAGVLAVLIFIFWLTKSDPRARSKNFAIYFKEQTLDGLQINSAITMKGIKVGTVESLKIAPNNIEEVRVVAKLAQGTPVKINTRAVIQRNLLTGLASIDLIGSTQQSPMLDHNLDGEELPVIFEGRSRIEAVTKSLPEVISHVSRIAESVNEFVTPENQKAFSNTLKNLDRISTMFASESDNIKGLIRDVQKASVAVERLGTTGNKQLESIGNGVDEAMKQLQMILVKIDATAGDLSSAVTASTRVLVQQFQSLSQNLSNAARDVSTTSEEFGDLPRVIYGPAKGALGPGESLK